MRLFYLFAIALVPLFLYGGCSSCQKTESIHLSYDLANPTKSFYSALKKAKEDVLYEINEEEETDSEKENVSTVSKVELGDIEFEDDKTDQKPKKLSKDQQQYLALIRKGALVGIDRLQKIHSYSKVEFYLEDEPKRENSFEEFSSYPPTAEIGDFTNEKIKFIIERKLYGTWFAPTYDQVQVKVKDGTVTLTGIVARESELADINKRVWSTDGVIKVLNKIRAKNIPAKFS